MRNFLLSNRVGHMMCMMVCAMRAMVLVISANAIACFYCNRSMSARESFIYFWHIVVYIRYGKVFNVVLSLTQVKGRL